MLYELPSELAPVRYQRQQTLGVNDELSTFLSLVLARLSCSAGRLLLSPVLVDSMWTVTSLPSVTFSVELFLIGRLEWLPLTIRDDIDMPKKYWAPTAMVEATCGW